MKHLSPFATLLPLLLFACTCPHLTASPGDGRTDGPATEDDEFLEQWLRGDDLSATDIPGLDEILEPLPLWGLDTALKTGVGYRDNVMLSAFDPQAGSFLLGGFETSLIRTATEGPQFSVFLDGEHLEFVSGDDLPSDTFLSGYSQLSFALPKDHTLSFKLMAFYLDQVVDLATADLPLEPLQIRGYGVTPGASLRKEWPTDFFAEISGSTSHQTFDAPLHDYWEYGPKIATGYSPGNSEISLSLEYLRRSYDDRRAFSAEGIRLPETDVVFDIIRPEIEVRHAWGAQRQWRSRTRLGLEFNRDNETDYFAYDRIRISQQLGYHRPDWNVQGRFQYSLYDYKVQKTAGGAEALERDSWGLSLEARRSFTERLDVFARYNFEQVESNAPGTDYDVNTWILGLGWRF